MNLITTIILLLTLYLVYSLYNAYNNIVKELRSIKEKCVKEAASEDFKSYLDKNNPIDQKINNTPKNMIKGLQMLLNQLNDK